MKIRFPPSTAESPWFTFALKHDAAMTISDTAPKKKGEKRGKNSCSYV